MTKIKLLFLVLYNLSVCQIFKGQYNEELVQRERYVRIMFYNVENLFDTEDDSLTNDNEFLPEEGKFWNNYRYKEKLHHISSVITAVGGWNPPEIVGLCEIENRKVLDDLCRNSALSSLNYKIIHKESQDPRGIDVALLYQNQAFTPISYKLIPVYFDFSPDSRTRDILYVKGSTNNKDTLDIFINHWPSRWGGQIDSERNRIEAARTLRVAVDSIFVENHAAKIIIMGDFNDYPEDRSLTDFLKANCTFNNIFDNELYNLSFLIGQKQNIGSHKHEGIWGILDQIIVSGALLNAKYGLSTKKENAFVFNPDFLLTNDENFTGKTNFRTYNGYKYLGGYSDHLPVFVDLDNLKK